MYPKKLFIILFIISSLLFGCSSLIDSTRKNLLGGDDERKKDAKQVKWVSKGQYDGLMAKYKNLNDKYERLKDEKIARPNSKFDQAGELSNSAAMTDIETVDAFSDSAGIAKAPSPSFDSSSSDGGKDLEFYRKAEALKANGKSEEALKIFQYLEGSQTKQLQVRAKKHIGDIYFSKGKYDLALQVYETIIRRNAFSGVVIKALENAVKCGSKLGLMDKKERYESILRDFFEIRV